MKALSAQEIMKQAGIKNMLAGRPFTLRVEKPVRKK